MPDPVGGAALKFGIGQAAKCIGKALKVKTTRNKLRSLLNEVTRTCSQFEQNNEVLGRRMEETEQLNTLILKRRELVNKKIPWYQFVMLPGHQDELQAAYEELRTHYDLYMQGQAAIIGQEILLTMRKDGKRMEGLCGPPPKPEFTVGLRGMLENLKVELRKPGASVLELTGVAGSGKSTLAIMLCWDDEVRGKFEKNVFFLKFSKAPKLRNMIRKLIYYCGFEMPEFRTDEEAINGLGVLLGQNLKGPILLVLDDVWPDSESVVNKLKFQLPSDYKIVVTSRVLNPRFGTPYELKPLDEKDALELFRHHAQLNDSNAYIPEDDLVRQVVRGCKSSPLALEVIGGLLCQKPFEFWKRMEESLKVSSVLDYDKDLLSRIQTALDMLDNELPIKECFMDLGLFPDAQTIPVAALIDMWTELHKLGEDGIDAMRIIHELTTGHLANLMVTRDDASDSDKYYNYYFVKQHDLLRELAIILSRQEPFKQRKRLISEATGKNYAQWWPEEKHQGMISRIWSLLTKCLIPKQQQVAALALFISTDWRGMQPDEALNLQKKYSFPKFIKKMRKLAVLTVTNYDFQPSEFSNFEILSRLSNLKRLRLEKVSVPFFCEMKCLRKLSLFMCHVNQAFERLQTSSALPNLVELSIDYCNDLVNLPASLCDIAPLKKLSITNCHKFSALPEDLGNLENLEVLRLNSCTDLEGIPDSIGRLSKLNFIDISDCVSIRKLPEDIGHLFNQSLIKLCIRGCQQLTELPVSVLMLKNLRNVVTVICDEERSALWEHLEARPAKLNIKKVDVVHKLTWLPVALP